MRKRKVLVHGYTMDNLGDDMFFATLFERYPEVIFYLPTLNVNYKKKFKKFSNVKVIDFFKVSKVTQHQVYKLPKLYSSIYMSTFDAVVCIGGSLFIDRKNPSKNDKVEAMNYSFIHDWAIANEHKKPYFLLGVNWGPCYNQYFYDYFNNAFDYMRDICFRDSVSYEIFKNKPQVRVAPDILFSHKLSIKDGPIKKQIAISVMNISRKQEIYPYFLEYRKKIIEMCDFYIEKGYEIKLLSFCSFEGDEEEIETIFQEVQDCSNVEKVIYKNDYEELLRVMSQSELIIATRFHSMILGIILGRPVFTIAYSKKIINVLKDINGEHSYIDIKDIKNLNFYDCFTYSFKLDHNKVFDIARKSEEQFKILDKLLKEDKE